MLAVSSINISPHDPKVVAGESLNLTCTATISGQGTPSFAWTGQMSHNQVLVQRVSGNWSIFTSTLTIEKVSQINPTVKCTVTSINNSTMMSSVNLSITGNSSHIVCL